METVTNKKSRLLLAGSVVGFALWIAFAVFTAKSVPTDFKGSFFEGLSNLFEGIAKSIKDGGAELKWTLGFLLWFIMLVASPVLGLVMWLKNSKKPAVPAVIAAVLSLNFISAILYIAGATPGKKTILLVAGCIGVFGTLILLALSIGMWIEDADFKTFFLSILVLALISAAALVLNFIGWRKNNAKMTNIAGFLYMLSIAGIPSGVLCLIGCGRLEKEAQAG